MANELHDPSNEGVQGLKGMRGLGQKVQETAPTPPPLMYTKKSMQAGRDAAFANMKSKEFVGNEQTGKSKLDKDIAFQSQLENINNYRGESQSGFELVGAGIAKAGVLAGTTFVNSTAGLIVGAIEAANAALSGEGLGGSMSKFWDNDVTKAMIAVNDYSEELMPNYYTDKEQEGPWYEHAFTANFLGDKMLKNMGFTIGSIGAGALTGGLINPIALRAGTKAGAIMARSLSTVVSAAGEATFEAANGSKEFMDTQVGLIDEYYQQRQNEIYERYGLIMQDIEGQEDEMIIDPLTGQPIGKNVLAADGAKKLMIQELAGLESEKENDINKINDQRINAGNTIAALNMAILGASNNIQFSKILSGGFNNAKKVSNVTMRNKLTGEIIDASQTGKAILDQSGEFVAKGNYKANLAKNIVANGFSEGMEEASQNLATNTAQTVAAANVNKFLGYKLNPLEQEDLNNHLNAFSKSVKEQFGSIDSPGWEEFALGFASGLIGVPMLKRNSAGKVRPTWTGGITEAIEETKEDMADPLAIEAVNAQIQSPEFIERYQNLIRRNSIQNEMDQALEEDDMFGYKNSEYSQLVSDAVMFRNIDQSDSYIQFLSSFESLSDEDIESIRSQGVDEATGKSIYEGQTNQQIKEDIQDKAAKTKKHFEEIVDNYEKNLVRFGDNLSKEAVEELTYIQSMTNNSIERFNDIYEGVSENLRQISAEIGRHNEYYGDDYNEKAQGISKALDYLINNNPNELLRMLNSKDGDKELSDLVKDVNDMLSKSYDHYDPETLDKIDDLHKLSNQINDLSKQYKSIVKNERTQKAFEKSIANQAEAVNNAVVNSKTDQAILNAQASNTMYELHESISEGQDDDTYKSALEKLVSNGNKNAIRLKEIRDIMYRVSDNLPYGTDINTILSQASNFDTFKEFVESLPDVASIKPILLAEISNVEEKNSMASATNSVYIPATTEGSEVAFEIDDDGNVTTPTPDTSKKSEVEYLDIPANSDYVNNLVVLDDNLADNEVKQESNQEYDTPESVSKNKDYYYPVIPQTRPEYTKVQDYRPWSELTIEKIKPDQKNIDGINRIYDYLESNGAFEYVNNGSLKAGDKLYLMKDKNYTGDDVFMVKKVGDNYQIVGSLPVSPSAISKQAGLKEHMDSTLKGRSVERNSMTIYTDNPLNVNTIMDGKLKFDNPKFETIDKIDRVDGDNYMFAVIGSYGQLRASIDESKIDKLNNLSKGSVYMLYTKPSGRIGMTKLNVRRFSNIDMQLDESNPYHKGISNAISELSQATNEQDVKNALLELGKFLDTSNIKYDFNQSKNGKIEIVLKKPVFDQYGKPVLMNGVQTRVYSSFKIKGTDQDKEYALQAVYALNMRMQVAQDRLGDPNYIKYLAGSGILTTKISSTKQIGAWFITDTKDKGMDKRTARPMPNKTESEQPNTTNSVMNASDIVFNGIVLLVDLEKKKIYNKGYEMDLGSKTQLVLDIAEYRKHYGDKMTGLKRLLDGYYYALSGRVVNIKTMQYVSPEKAELIKQKMRDIVNGVEAPAKTKLVANVSAVSNTNPVFGSYNESKMTIHSSKPESKFYKREGKVGYYQSVVKKGSDVSLGPSVSKSNMIEIGDINGKPLYLAKEVYYKEKANQPVIGSVDAINYVIVFPNGVGFTFEKDMDLSNNDGAVIEKALAMISKGKEAKAFDKYLALNPTGLNLMAVAKPEAKKADPKKEEVKSSPFSVSKEDLEGATVFGEIDDSGSFVETKPTPPEISKPALALAKEVNSKPVRPARPERGAVKTEALKKAIGALDFLDSMALNGKANIRKDASKEYTAVQSQQSETELSNTNKNATFVEYSTLEASVQQLISSQGITELVWNNMTPQEQEAAKECLSI